ncbi:MAG: hypothetical protein LBD75_05340 [Candidatus Peribacteria bacterium]|nr:hypothetical protein [Candidatus Peribacteria bacterium]
MLADVLTETLTTPVSSYRVQVLNLPLLQEANKTFTFTLSVTSQFVGENKKAVLFVDDCGEDLAVSYQGKVRSSIPLLLTPKGKHEFPLTIYRASNEECILTFRLLDQENTLLASTQVGVLPQCPTQRAKKPIDEGLDYTLPEIQANQPTSEKTATSSPQSSQKKQEKQPSSIKNDTLLISTDDELSTAFNLLVIQGLFTTGDKAKLSQPLTRLEAARLFVNIAIANDLPRDTKKSCNFLDMQGASTVDIAIAQLACQFNIMGVHPDYTPLDNFMPSLTIPSEQLTTAFSRLMWRNLYEQPENETAYYELHLNTMYNLSLIDQKVIKADSTLADFVIITARAMDQEQLTIGEIEQIDLECETGDETIPTCTLAEEKPRRWFW